MHSPVIAAVDSPRPFSEALGTGLTKRTIRVLQINLGKRCNLACTHCHVEAGPKRTEAISPEVCEQLIAVIRQFPQIQTVDLTGGAPEMHDGFRILVQAAAAAKKEVIVRSPSFLRMDLKICRTFSKTIMCGLWLRCLVICQKMSIGNGDAVCSIAPLPLSSS
jgi:hypothetical protein